MAYTPVLAGRRFVEKHHIEAGAVGLVFVRPAGEVDNLVTLDATGAREHGEGADARHVIDLESQNVALFAGGDAALDTVLARVDVAHERFQPVSHKLYRALEQHRHRYRGKVVRVGMHLDAKRAAHVFADDAHQAFGQIKLA